MSNENIVEELRECAAHAGGEGYTYNVMRRAAAEIKRLRGLIGLAAEFDAAPDDAEWEPPHPIFNMAQEIETLAAELAAIRAAGGEAGLTGEYHADVNALLGRVAAMASPDFDGNVSKLMTVAQHQRIVAAMAAELEQYKEVARVESSLRADAEARLSHAEGIGDSLSRALESMSSAKVRLEAELEAARKQEPDSDADLATRMKAAGMMSVAELLAGAPLDAFTRHAAVKDLQSLLRWAEMRRAECLKAQARYDLGERDKSDDLYEWTVAHCAVFTELHVNIRAALAGLPPLAGQVSGQEWVPVSERLPEAKKDGRMVLAFVCGIVTTKATATVRELVQFAKEDGERCAVTHWMPLPAAPALLATPSMEV